MVIVTEHARTPSDDDDDDVDDNDEADVDDNVDNYEAGDIYHYPPMVIVTQQTRTPSDEKGESDNDFLFKSSVTTMLMLVKKYIFKELDISSWIFSFTERSDDRADLRSK